MPTTKTDGKLYTPLPVSFYERRTDEVAVDLLGKLIIRETPAALCVARIVETEAYFGQNDPASHACRGMTPRNAIMFGRGGKAYVYLNYGVHNLLNVVTEEDGRAGAVLIRALEPLGGLEAMFARRPVKNTNELTNGPGKLTQALAIDLSDNGTDMTVQGALYIAEPDFGGAALGRPGADGAGKSGGTGAPDGFTVAATSRIGISAGTDMLLRFVVDGNPYVSR